MGQQGPVRVRRSKEEKTLPRILLSREFHLPGTQPGSEDLPVLQMGKLRPGSRKQQICMDDTQPQIAPSLPLFLASHFQHVFPEAQPRPASLPRRPAQNGLPGTPTQPLTLQKPGEELADRGMRLRPGHMSIEEICDPKFPSDSHPFNSFNFRPLLPHQCESYTIMAPSEKSTCPGSQNTPSSSFQAPRAQVTCALPNLPQGTSLGHSSVSRSWSL